MTLRPVLIVAALLAASCGRGAPTDHTGATRTAAINAAAPQPSSPPAPASAVPDAAHSLAERIARIEAAVARWRTARSLTAARSGAEEARNLIVGPGGPDYGDADGDGVIAGASSAGLLPGLNGEPGIASGSTSACVKRDVLGGDWTDPAPRWAILRTAIVNWKPGNNTFPKLPSHAQRIVGWASLTLATGSLETARDYAGHAKIHADISRRAVMECGR